MTTALRQTVLLLQAFGGPEHLSPAKHPFPVPGPGEVLKSRSSPRSVQSTDVMLRKAATLT